MDQARKQRLVGTTVLIALAVILIPMILDFSNKETDQGQDIHAPKAPDVNNMQVLPLDVWSQKRDPQLSTESVYVDPKSTDDSPDLESKPVEVVASPASEEEKVDKKQQAAAIEQKPKAIPKPVATAVEPVKDPEATKQAKVDKTMAGRAWVVQLVSVSKRENALAFRQKLDDLGYTAYVSERRRQDGSLLYRVRVGPEVLRSKANSLQKRLNKDTGISGLIMRYQKP